MNKNYLVTSFFNLFECYLKDFQAATAEEVKRMLQNESKRTSANQINEFSRAKVLSMNPKQIISSLENNFLQSLVLVFYPMFTSEGKRRLDEFVKNILHNLNILFQQQI